MMRVQRMVLPNDQGTSWTVLDVDGEPVAPIEAWLAHLWNIQRSPNTQRAYATDLRDYFLFLGGRQKDWRRPSMELLGEWMAWLRTPQLFDGPMAVPIDRRGYGCGPATVSRKLSAVSAFYEFHARHGLDLGPFLTVWQPGGRGGGGSWKPFLTDIASTRHRRRTISIAVPHREPRLRTAGEVQALLDNCTHLRDRLLLGLLFTTGIRIGEALGARHEDLVPRRGEFRVVARDNENGARAKSGGRTVPVPPALMRLYGDYVTDEYGALDSDYVFVNLWSAPRGAPMTYANAYDLAVRLGRRTGIEFEFHQLRHTYATDLLRRGVSVEVVSKLLGHRHSTTTLDTYAHLSDADTRRQLDAVGFFEHPAVQL